MEYKRITLIAGHYGSGKTNIAVNMALDLRKAFDKVTCVDLDIVNPYFRTKDSEKLFKEKGIRFISSQFANTNLDVPAIPQEVYSIIDDKSHMAVVDIGGDDRGAFALGRYRGSILKEGNFDMLFVINKYRPLTKTAEDTVEIMKEIEAAGKIKFTGILNNSNLGEETTAEDFLSSVDYAEKVSEMTGLKIFAHCVKDSLSGEVSKIISDVFPLKLQDKII